MSVHISSKIWNTNLPSGTKIVALALADMANDENEAWPSIASLEKRCGMQDEAIRGHIAKLVAMGLIRRESRFLNNRQTSNLYIFSQNIPSGKTGGGQMAYPPEIPEGAILKNTPLPPPEKQEGEIHHKEPKEIPKEKAVVKSKARGSEEELREYAKSLGLPASDGTAMFNHWESNGWKRGKEKLACWKSGMRSWRDNGWLPSQKNPQSVPDPEIDYAAMPGDGQDPVLWMIAERKRLDAEEAQPIETED